MSPDRQPPADLPAERSVLSCGLLAGGEVLDLVGDILPPRDFFADKHREIWITMLALHAAGVGIDHHTVRAELLHRQRLANAGGEEYLLELQTVVPELGHVEDHARIVIHRAQVRRIISAASRIVALGYGPVLDVDAYVDEAESAMLAAGETGARAERLRHVGEVAAARYTELGKAQDEGRSLCGLSTGLPALNALITGLQPSQLILIAGRPGHGKSSLALQLCVEAAKLGQACALFSLEMPAKSLVDRLFAMRAEIPVQLVRVAKLTAEQWSAALRVTNEVQKWPLFIDDTPGITAQAIRGAARRLAHRAPLGLVVVDYLQLMNTAAGERIDTREQAVSSISRALKALAMELEIPVVAISQLNRGVESRPDQRPRLSDLRESGSLEQDADVVIFVFRGELYRPNDQDLRGVAELIIGKQREGRIGACKVRWTGQFCRFDDVDGDDPQAHLFQEED